MEDIITRIHDYALEEIMGDRFGRYAKTIIQDRAIPDVRDGLKPVQRRILYCMHKDHNTYDKPTRKCAKTVGNVMGNYHPHGDSSIYEALIRMSQWWKQNTTYVFVQGNNGSMDGDPPAAYRYTEARLEKITNEMLKDIDKNTVKWAPNFDDTELEPTVLPAKFPNLLVNGANGISAGYATNIPPHNLGEIIDATIKRIDSPNCHFDSILEIVKGPDFPTGGIVEGKAGIIDAFKTGKGKVIVKSKYEYKKEKGKEQIIIDEIPFDVNKALLVKKIDDIRIDKKIDGIAEVRDETDKEGLRIVIDLKTNANKEIIINYLLKNTELQISYNYNMVSIVNRRPMTLGIVEILDAYIEFQKEVITSRTEFDLNTYKNRLHIVDGFLKMISILDEVIKVIRASKNKSDAIDNLVTTFNFTKIQADAIVTLQLYRLTNTDVVALQNERADLLKFIEALESILCDEEKLKAVMKHELKKIKEEYATPRKTKIVDEITEIKLDTTDLISKENVIVVVTNDGYIKRVPMKSYNKDEETLLKPGDYVKNIYELTTLDNLLVFTNLGNYLYIPVHTIPEVKWKELGKHINNIIMLSTEETVINSISYNKQNKIITLATKLGMIKRCNLIDFEVTRYSRPMVCMKLKENDKLLSVSLSKEDNIFITRNGYYLRFKESEIPVIGIKASGVKGINLKDDEVVSNISIDNNDEYINVFTDHLTGKRVKISELAIISRAKKGNLVMKKNKTVTYNVINAFNTLTRDIISYKIDTDIKEIKNSEIPIMDISSNGSVIFKDKVDNVFKKSEKESLNNKKQSNEEIEKEEVIEVEKKESGQISMDDFLNDFKM